MVEQEVEQKTTDMQGGLPGIVAEPSRRQWTLLSMERRRTLTTPAKKAAGD